MGMYKKNSILDRPIRPPSARNVESALCRARPRDRGAEAPRRAISSLRVHGGLLQQAPVGGPGAPLHHLLRHTPSSPDCRHGRGPEDDPALGRRRSFRRHARPGAVGTRGELLRGSRRGVRVAALPGRGVSPSGAFRPRSPGTRSPRLLRDHRFAVPEDDPTDLATQKRAAPPPAGSDGTYDPITHRWVVEPTDASALDREAMPPGQRSKLNLYHP